MECIIAEYSGFCHGVKNTISNIEKLLNESDLPVYCIGLPVHNPQITEKLIKQGLNVVKTLDEIEKGVFLIRAHGLSPKVIIQAKQKGLQIVNTTCNIVVNVQKIVRELIDGHYNVIIVGEANHPEVKAVYGYSDEKAFICSSSNDVDKMLFKGKLGIVAQTTFSIYKYKEIISKINELNFPEIRIFNTICNSMARRSNAACKVASNVDLMLVVGGKMSSNTKRLCESCYKVNKNTHHIETADEFKEKWFVNVNKVGLTAGASTPQWLIDEIKTAVEKY